MSFLKYVEEHGQGRVLSSDELQTLRRAYRSAYHRGYYYQRKQQVKRLTLRLNLKQYILFKNQAEAHGKSINQFIKEISLAYLDQSYVPRDSKPIEEVIKELNRIGTNINQIVQALNRSLFSQSNIHTLPKLRDSYSQLLAEVQQGKKTLYQVYNSPPLKLQDALIEYISLHPEKLPDLISFLQKETRHAPCS